MKKCLVVIMIMALLLPVVSFADQSLDFYAGYCHTEMDEKNGDAPFFSVLHFTENHKCYYAEKKFYPDRPGQDNAYIGTWEYNENNEVVIKIRDNTIFVFHLLDNGDLINVSSRMIYNRVNAIWN
jgi:hypothetical protein